MTADNMRHNDDSRLQDFNRREFLESSAKNAAGMAVGMVGLAGAAARAGESQRVRAAVIGVRSHGRRLARTMAGFPDAELVALCDVDENLRPAALAEIGEHQAREPRWERDFRRILDDPATDAIVIATPDHWHALITVMACQAGKDVYVEAPLAHNILEGERIAAAARRSGRVVQCGMQQRSGPHFRSAVEFVRNGRLGSVALAKAWTTHLRKPIGTKRDSRVPDRVDYEMWLGPAPLRRFNPNRFHANWRWFWDYGSGELGQWGVHMLDIARWGLAVDLPRRVSAVGGKFYFEDDQETPDTLVVNYDFDGKTIVWEHRQWSNHPLEGRSTAAAFYGEQGTLIVDRGGWKVYHGSDVVASAGGDLLAEHLRDFVNCVKSRNRPHADVDVGHLSGGLCHLGNISHRIGREIAIDPSAGGFGLNADVAQLLGREYRKPWQLPLV